MQINWTYCQSHSDELLASGLNVLRSSDYIAPTLVSENGAGVYLVSLNGGPVYIGEAKNLCSRLKQQFKPATSTFYKNYTKSLGDNSPEPITAFRLQILRTQIGRKELEEFGIVHIPTPLNRFQRDKRKMVGTIANATSNSWGAVQSSHATVLDGGSSIIHDKQVTSWQKTSPAAKPGLYLVYDSDHRLIYVGESTDVQERHRTHSGQTYFSALRRNIGRDILGYQYVPKKKKQFYPEQDARVSAFLNSCTIRYMSVEFGRLELEEHLIQNLQPVLNRKSRD